MKFRLGDFVEVANPELKTYGITGKISDDGTNYWFSDCHLNYVCYSDLHNLGSVKTPALNHVISYVLVSYVL